jgi:glycosyltransferase involved in cell wall biosynthesis
MRAMASALAVTAGLLTWELGIEFAIVAVAFARAEGVDLRYDIVGDGPERDRALYTAFDLGLEGVVCVIRPDRSVVGRLAEADVFLWPDLTGRSSSAARELAALGIDVVSTVPATGVHFVPPRDPALMGSSLASVAGGHRRPAQRALGSHAVDAILEELGCE